MFFLKSPQGAAAFEKISKNFDFSHWGKEWSFPKLHFFQILAHTVPCNHNKKAFFEQTVCKTFNFKGKTQKLLLIDAKRLIRKEIDIARGF